VKRCLSGQRRRVATHDKYKALIYSIPVKYGLPQQEAAGRVSGNLHELLTHLRRFERTARAAQWLIQVAHHKCITEAPATAACQPRW